VAESRVACSGTQGQLCVLAEDCNQPDYKKLVEALCAEHNVSLLSVPEAKQLGQWAGVRFPPATTPLSSACSLVHAWAQKAWLRTLPLITVGLFVCSCACKLAHC
jgi:ribosomal protein L7Ae-like RNA K-turn-binding protein